VDDLPGRTADGAAQHTIGADSEEQDPLRLLSWAPSPQVLSFTVGIDLGRLQLVRECRPLSMDSRRAALEVFFAATAPTGG
jgi:hypothetical protein